MKQNFVKYIIIILSFYAIYLGGLPFVFSKVLPVLCENISVNSNYDVSVENPRLILNILPKARVKADSIEITEKYSNDLIKIDSPQVIFRLLPLLSGRLHVKKISASNVELSLTIQDKIELDKDFFNKLNKSKVKCDSAFIQNFNAVLLHKNESSPITYSLKDVVYEKNNRYLRINLDSNLNIKNSNSGSKIRLFLPKNNDVNKSVVDIKVQNLDIAPFGDYLKHYLPIDLKELKGIVNINVDKNKLDANLTGVKILMKDDAKSIICPKNLNVTSDFQVTSKEIKFKTININSDKISAIVRGQIFNCLDKPLTRLDLNVQLNKSRVEDIVNMLPPIVVEEFNVYKLKKYKFFGDAIGNFNIKGDVIEPEITGDVYISNGILIEPIKNAQGATVKLDFTGKYVNFDVFVPAGGAEKVWVKGGVELYNVKYSDMRIWSTKNVNLKTAENKVVPLHEILNFIIGPVPIMDVNGYGNIDITVKGNRKTPHVWGVLNLNNVTTFFHEIPDLVLTNANATLNFNDEIAVFKTKKGLVNNKPIDINGTCTLAGKFDFDVKSSNQDIGYLYRAIETSTMIDEIKSILPKLDYAKGPINLDLKVFGALKYIEDLKFNQNFFTKGHITLLDNSFGMQNISLNNVKGELEFDGVNAGADIQGLIGKSKLNATMSVKNNIADLRLSIPKLSLNDIYQGANDIKDDLGNVFLEINAKYKGKIDTIEFDKVDFRAKVLGAEEGNRIKPYSGEITLKNNKLAISNLKGNFFDNQSNFDINLNANSLSSNPKFTGNIRLKSFNLESLNHIAKYSVLPKELREELNKIKFENGRINLSCIINNNKMNAYTDLGGISFIYSPLELPIKIINGSLIMRNNSLRLNKINLMADGMPILTDGEIYDIFTKQKFNLYFNSKPKQEFIDKYINKNQIYPIKIKGDIVYTTKLKGVINDFDLKADVNMAKDSSIYHLGATVGDIENAIVLNLDTKVLNRNILKIKEFSYDKIISSLGRRETRLNMLKARGGIEIFKDDLAFHDLYIKTQNPTDARIFNIIFRKPNIKQGQFTSDLRFNGKLSDPRLLGSFHIFETNIPFLDTTMKNISFVFKDKTIDLTSSGEILGNDIKIDAILRNKLTTPYYVENATLNSKILDLNDIINKLKLSQVEDSHTFESFENFDTASIIVKNINMNADSIKLRNINAEKFKAQASLDEKRVLNVDKFKFNIANGELNGRFRYNLLDNKTQIDMKAKSIDANALTYAIFDLDNQIYGDLTGDIDLSCNGADFENCMRTLNGKSIFKVSDGRMPKLGSLEYLLKAGNLLKGGLTGISINNVIDIITPLKTGEFSDINGSIVINDGIADDIQIATKGKDLSLFLVGNYNLSTSIADMHVLGLLSKKISTMFGPIGNLSLNTLFNVIPGVDLSKDTKVLDNINKIPGIELSNKAYRKFIAEIKGNINGEEYVTSFKWIN